MKGEKESGKRCELQMKLRDALIKTIRDFESNVGCITTWESAAVLESLKLDLLTE